MTESQKMDSEHGTVDAEVWPWRVHRGDTNHVRFRMRIGALPVFNGDLVVHISDGAVVMTQGRYLPQLPVFQGEPAPATVVRGAVVASGRLDDIDPQGEPRLGAWMQRVSSRPAFATDVAEMDAFIAKGRGAAA